MKTSKEITQEIRRIRERAKSLSGFWISEFAAAIEALEWALGKRDKPPSSDVGSPASEHGKIAERLLETVGKERKKPSKGAEEALEAEEAVMLLLSADARSSGRTVPGKDGPPKPSSSR